MRSVLWMCLPLLAHAERCEGCGRCLDQAPRESLLLKLMHMARMTMGGKHVMLVKDWPSNMIVSNITYILIEEVLGYQDSLQIEFGCCTRGSFRDLASERAQISMEMWSSSDAQGFARYSPAYVHAGESFDYARSGLYFRPSPADAELLLAKGRFYGHFNETVLPLLPTPEQVMHLCTPDLASHCIETPNRACLVPGSGCKALLKSTDSLDPGIVERMIANASLPLVIVYTGYVEQLYLYGGGAAASSSAAALHASLANHTLLFYAWEPQASVVTPGSGLMRLNFDPPVACEDGMAATAYPLTGRKACDFAPGGAHKGLSQRIAQSFSDIEHLVTAFKLSAAEINAMETGNHSAARDWAGAACEWVRAHEASTVRGWLLNPPLEGGLAYLDEMVLGLVLLLSVVWLLWPSLVGTPGIDDPMAAGHAWDYASDAVKPMRLVLTLHWLVSLGRKLLREAMQQGRALRKRRRVLPPEGPGGTTNTTTTTTSAALGAESSTAPSTPRFQRLSAESPPALAEHSMSGLQRVRTAEAASAMPRLSTADLEEEHSSYSMREECHVAFIQGIVRSKLLHGGLQARQSFKQRLIDGVQFAQASVVGLEGTANFRVGLVRGRLNSHLGLLVHVVATDGSAVRGVDYQLKELNEATGRSTVAESVCVAFEPGARFAYVELDLTDNGVSFASNEKRAWTPTRSFDLRLSVHERTSGALCRQHTGSNERCHVVVVDDDPWPSRAAVESGRKAIYWSYVWQVLRSNVLNESFWLLGVCMRACTGIVLRPIVFMLLLNEALPEASMTKSCNLATLLVFGRLVEHVTEGWFSSAGRMTFDITLNWVLAKWADLPMGDVMDYDTMRRFRTMVDVVTSTHFYNRSYPAFISLVSTLINLVFVFGFAIYLSSMEGANSQLSTLLPLIYICVFILLAAVRLTSTRGYLDVERRWLEHDGELAIALDDFLGNSAVHKSFRTSLTELARVSKQVKTVSFVGYHAWSMSNAHGKSFAWMMWLLEAAFVFCGPIITEVWAMEAGTLLAILSNIGSLNAACTELLDCMERLDVAELVLSLLARVLNEGHERGRARANESTLKMTCIRRAVQEVGKDELMIELHRVRYESRDLTDQHGGKLHFACDGCAPLGELIGLRMGSDGNGTSLRHRILCDLIGGMRVPLDGAVVLPPHVRVGTVPLEPLFIGSRTLLDNLRYAGGERVPEKTIWTLCKNVGLPAHLCASAKGQMLMARLSFTLSLTEISLFSLVRTLLAMPDLLLVNLLAFGESKRIGVVFHDYVAGAPPTLLGTGVQAHRTQQVVQSGSFRVKKSARALPSKQSARPSGSASGAPESKADRRSVIWHASDSTLRAAGVRRALELEGRRLLISRIEAEPEAAEHAASERGGSVPGRAAHECSPSMLGSSPRDLTSTPHPSLAAPRLQRSESCHRIVKPPPTPTRNPPQAPERAATSQGLLKPIG